MLSGKWPFWRRGKKASPALLCCSTPVNTGQSPNAISMLGQRRRLYFNIETALGEWQVFADVLAQSIQQTQCWISVGPAS